MKSTRGLAIACLVGLAVLGAATVPQAARAQAPGEEKKVTINVKDAPLRSVIDLIFAGSGLQYAIDPTVPNVLVTLSLKDVSIQQALRVLIGLVRNQVPGLTFSREGEAYIIRIRQPMQAPPPAPEEAPPPELTAQSQEITWEKIPIQFNYVGVIAMAFGGGMLPTEANLMMGGGMGMGGLMGGYGGGFGGLGGLGGFGGGFGGLGGLGGFGGFGGLGGLGGFGGFGGGNFGGFGGFGGGNFGGRRF